MNKLLITLFILSASQLSMAQEHAKVIFHLQSADTLVYKSIVSQISNLKKELPGTAVEILCHGPGIDFLRVEKSKYATSIQRLGFADVGIVGCEFTMTQRKIKKEAIVPFATTVPYGLVELVTKQQAGWIYIKAGF
jgi:intracellular sulfur oxidation DsrE/DsrF family protein